MYQAFAVLRGKYPRYHAMRIEQCPPSLIAGLAAACRPGDYTRID